MTGSWQNIAALAVVALAGAFVARAACRAVLRRGTPGCGCGTCPSGSDRDGNGPVQLVSLESPPRPRNSTD